MRTYQEEMALHDKRCKLRMEREELRIKLAEVQRLIDNIDAELYRDIVYAYSKPKLSTELSTNFLPLIALSPTQQQLIKMAPAGHRARLTERGAWVQDEAIALTDVLPANGIYRILEED